MQGMYAFALVLALLTLHDVSSFRPRSLVRSSSSPTARKATDQRPVTNKGSYEQMLAQAKQQKLAKQGAGSVDLSQTRPQQQQPQQQRAPTSSSSAPQESATSSLPPFSDDLYAHLKFMIEKLSQRMKSEQALSPSDLQRFQRAVDAVIKDARENGGSTSTRKESSSSSPSSAAAVLVSKSGSSIPSSSSSPPRAAVTTTTTSNSNNRNGGTKKIEAADVDDSNDVSASDVRVYGAGEGPRNSEKPDPNSPFSSLHGLSNTWQIPGMENMTTEQYYAAINKRISSMKVCI